MGLTVLDAGVVIAVLDAADGHHAAARAALSEALARGDELVLPASAYAESLVGPSRRGQAAVAALDALVLATAETADADLLITTDGRLPAGDLRVQVV